MKNQGRGRDIVVFAPGSRLFSFRFLRGGSGVLSHILFEGHAGGARLRQIPCQARADGGIGG